MTFLQRELKKVTDMSQLCSMVTFVGDVGYVRISEEIRLRLEFLRSELSIYSGISMTMINRKEGVIDKNNFSFIDVLGIKAVKNPNFKEGICPHIWKDSYKFDWYVYKPIESDYQKIAEMVDCYISMFQDEGLSRGPQMKL
ncbi:hypothetical protein DFR60_11449 [Hungatella effluvii]|uniref:Uncharacterized protein n=1 Tax=Hungatella effluvii TaxID=1096246 RepID=A0A2V3Y0I7_9FIRM|nr:hypothetical protein [Hungatella effluvii]PXX49260.1 hypothetical protein DFR60_11449 [Hungatella effluvii]